MSQKDWVAQPADDEMSEYSVDLGAASGRPPNESSSIDFGSVLSGEDYVPSAPPPNPDPRAPDFLAGSEAPVLSVTDQHEDRSSDRQISNSGVLDLSASISYSDDGYVGAVGGGDAFGSGGGSDVVGGDGGAVGGAGGGFGGSVDGNVLQQSGSQPPTMSDRPTASRVSNSSIRPPTLAPTVSEQLSRSNSETTDVMPSPRATPTLAAAASGGVHDSSSETSDVMPSPRATPTLAAAASGGVRRSSSETTDVMPPPLANPTLAAAANGGVRRSSSETTDVMPPPLATPTLAAAANGGVRRSSSETTDVMPPPMPPPLATPTLAAAANGGVRRSSSETTDMMPPPLANPTLAAAANGGVSRSSSLALNGAPSPRAVATPPSARSNSLAPDASPSPRALATSPSARSTGSVVSRSPSNRQTSAKPSSRPSSRSGNHGAAQQSVDDDEDYVAEDDGDSSYDTDFDAASVSPSAHSSRHPGPPPNARRTSSVASSSYSEDDQFDSAPASRLNSVTPMNRRPSTAPNSSRRPMSALRQSCPSPSPSNLGVRSSMEYGGVRARMEHSRPASAAPRDRQGAIMQDLTRRHPSTWDPRDVGTWVEYLGLGQYRRKFMHNLVDGRLLLRLTSQQLKSELGIGPLGHRTSLLDAIAALAEGADGYEEMGSARDGGETPMRSRMKARPMSSRPPHSEYPRRPATASPQVIPPDSYLGPASGKITVYEQRAKLLFELDRAAYRASQQKSLADQLLHTAHLSGDEVAKLRGLLKDLEHKNKQVMAGANNGFDSNARIPWHPVGHGTRHNNWHPEKFARPGEDPVVDLTFKPKLSAASKKMLQEQSGMQGEAGGGSSFLTRLENDARKRERTREEAARTTYSPESLFQDPMRVKRQQQRDFDYLNEYLISKAATQNDTGLPNNPNEYEEEINDIFTQHADEWQLKDATLRGILAAKAERKVTAASSAVRTMVFMQRYELELKQKQQRLKDLEKQWWEQAMGNPKASKEEEDTNQMFRWFALLGWRGDGDDAITDDRLAALLQRVRAYKTLYMKWRESVRDNPADQQGEPVVDINWESSPWSSDGLGNLMDSEMQRSQSKVETHGQAASGGDGEGMNKTKFVPEGAAVKVTPVGQGGGANYLSYTVKLLALCHDDDLRKLQDATGFAKSLSTYRIIRRQKFLEFTEAKIKEKDRAKKALFESMCAPKKVITKTEEDVFFERLMDDNVKRRTKAEKAMADKRSKESDILASSAMYSRPKSAR